MTNITVGIPAFNAMPYLPEAVESILSQSYQDFRLIIINDGSTDGSACYLNSIKDSRVTVIHQVNQGLTDTLNRSLAICQTEYYSRMDADDVATPDRIARQLRFLEANPDVVMVGSQVDFLLDRRLIQGHRMPLDHNTLIHLLMLGRPVICHPSIMVRMSAVNRIGGYRETGAGEDFDFWLRLAEVGKIRNMDKCLLHYRMHLSSIVATKRNAIRCGKAYAIQCARRRIQGLTEIEYHIFETKWNAHQNFLTRLYACIDSWSTIQYRKALLSLAQRHGLMGYLHLVAAALCRPGACLLQIKLRILSFINRRPLDPL